VVVSQQMIIHFFFGNENANHHLGTGCFINKRIRSPLKRVEFVSDRTSYVIRRGQCDISVPNVLAPTEGKSDDTKG
jgi:hypothetical protein